MFNLSNQPWVLGLSLIGMAAMAAEPTVEMVLKDIARYEQQTAGTESKPTAQRTLKLLRLTRQRLDGAENQQDPAWIDADKKLQALQSRLQRVSQGGKAAPITPPVAQSTNQPTSTATAAPEMISHQRVKLKKLARDIGSATDTVDKNGPKPFQSVQYRDQQEKKLQHYQQQLTKFEAFAADPQVQQTAAALQQLQNMLNFGAQQADKTLAEIGDVQQRLLAVDQGIQKLRIAPAPQQPFQQGQLKQWLVGLANARQAATQTLPSLQIIAEKAYLPLSDLSVSQGGAYDFQDINRLANALNTIVGKVDGSLQQFSADLDFGIQQIPPVLQAYAEYNPADDLHQNKFFLGEGVAEERRQVLLNYQLLVSEAADFDKQLNRPTQQQRLALLQQVNDSLTNYDAKYQQALQQVRLPKPASTDPELLKIAEQTLNLEKYTDIGPIERLVINAPKVHREKESSDVEYDAVDVSLSGTVTLSGTKTTYFYAWDEFQVASVEPVADKYYIFYSTLKYFTSGAQTTPLNKWVVAARFKGSEIPQQNIALD